MEFRGPKAHPNSEEVGGHWAIGGDAEGKRGFGGRIVAGETEGREERVGDPTEGVQLFRTLAGV
jgi:hypothetical protein